MALIVFANYPFIQTIPKATPLAFGLYDTLSNVVWSIAICYIIFACIHDSGGPINWFLSLPMWQPLSRLTYIIFLIHCAVISTSIVSFKTPPYFSEFSAFQNFISFFVLTAFVAIPLTLAFEMPIDAINKLTTPINRINQQNTSIQKFNEIKWKKWWMCWFCIIKITLQKNP